MDGRSIVVELEKTEGLLRKAAAEMSAAERWTVFFRYVGSLLRLWIFCINMQKIPDFMSEA
jgi:hypothetical protein